MAELHSTPEANKAAALAKLKQHDDAIRANGIKIGYANRDAEWRSKLGVKDMEEASELFQLRQRPTIQEELKHGRFRFWQGVAAGAFVTMLTLGIGMAIYTRSVMDPAFDAAARMQMQQDVVSTLERGSQQ